MGKSVDPSILDPSARARLFAYRPQCEISSHVRGVMMDLGLRVQVAAASKLLLTSICCIPVKYSRSLGGGTTKRPNRNTKRTHIFKSTWGCQGNIHPSTIDAFLATQRPRRPRRQKIRHPKLGGSVNNTVEPGCWSFRNTGPGPSVPSNKGIRSQTMGI